MTLTVFILTLTVLLLLIFGSTLFLKSPRRAALLLLVVYVADTLWTGLPAIPMGLHIYAQDILFVFLITAAALRYILGLAHIERGRLAILTLFLLVLFSLGRGIATYGTTQAGVECRGFFWLFAGSAYFSSFHYLGRRLAEMIRLWHRASCALIVIAVFRWIATGFHMRVVASWAESGEPMRVLNAGGAMFLCIGLFFSLMLKTSRKGRKWQQNLYYVIGPVLILLQHRTVWVVTVLGMVWIFRNYARLLKKSLIIFAITAGIGGMLVVSTFGFDFVLESLQQSATNDNTFLWRVAGWYQLVFLRMANTMHLIFGDAFGAGFDRFVSGADVVASPHSFYVETYLRLGIVGLCILLWLFKSQFRACEALVLNRAATNPYINPRLWGLFIIFLVTYSITYNPGYEQSIILGIIVGLNVMRSPSSTLKHHRIATKSMLPEPSR